MQFQCKKQGVLKQNVRAIGVTATKQQQSLEPSTAYGCRFGEQTYKLYLFSCSLLFINSELTILSYSVDSHIIIVICLCACVYVCVYVRVGVCLLVCPCVRVRRHKSSCSRLTIDTCFVLCPENCKEKLSLANTLSATEVPYI
jgi:hypothetical protein